MRNIYLNNLPMDAHCKFPKNDYDVRWIMVLLVDIDEQDLVQNTRKIVVAIDLVYESMGKNCDCYNQVMIVG